MKNVVITGATSMLGVALIDSILSNGKDVTIYAVVREDTVKLDRLPDSDKVKLIRCNIDNYEKLPQLINEVCDVFYHIAWASTGQKRNLDIMGQCMNVQYSMNALRSAKRLGCSKFIATGSQAEFGPLNLPKISPNSPADPVQPYGVAKYASCKLCMEESKNLDMDCLWVRVFSIYGLYDQPTTMVSSTINKMLKGEHTSFSPATQLWDYLYSTDAGDALRLIGEKSKGRKIYCLGSGVAKPLYEYIYTIRDMIDPKLTTGIGEIPFGENAVKNLCADISTLTEDTGWTPKYSFEQGIKEILDELSKKN